MAYGIHHNFMKQLNEAQEKALREFTKQVADENNVSEEVALYLITKEYNLKYDIETENVNGVPELVLTFQPKSVEEFLETIEDKTEWEKRMHKRLLEETCKVEGD